MKPSERIEELHKALRLLGGKDPNEEIPKFYYIEAIIKFLDEEYKLNNLQDK